MHPRLRGLVNLVFAYVDVQPGMRKRVGFFYLGFRGFLGGKGGALCPPANSAISARKRAMRVDGAINVTCSQPGGSNAPAFAAARCDSL